MKLIYDDRIEQYLAGEMSSEERSAFEHEMQENEALRASVIFFREANIATVRAYTRKVLNTESRKFRYKLQNIGIRMQNWLQRWKLAVISALSALLLAAGGAGVAVSQFAQTARNLFVAVTPYITNISLGVARGADGTFVSIDRQFEDVRNALNQGNYEHAQQLLNDTRHQLADVDGAPEELKLRCELADFTQAVIWAKDGHPHKAKRALKQISDDSTNACHSIAADILKQISRK